MTDREETEAGQSSEDEPTDQADTTSQSKPSRTPLFVAQNSPRYHRQQLIASIQQQTQSRLICYVAGPQTRIAHDDAMQFRDFFHNIEDGENIELLLHTNGGDVDAAEKLVEMVRDKVGESRFRIVVPHLAKSAGTLMVLGADSVAMSDTSELGPIDPQVIIGDVNGGAMYLPAQSLLDAYDAHSKELRSDPADPVATLMLSKLNPTFRQTCMALMDRTRTLAEKLLRDGMFHANAGNWTETAGELIDTTRWRTHSQVISASAAQNPPLNLSVDSYEPHDSLWQKYWQLYCLQRLAISEDQKLFESDIVSLP